MLYATFSWGTGTTCLIEPGPRMEVKGRLQPPVPGLKSWRREQKRRGVQVGKWDYGCHSTPMIYRGMLFIRVAGYLFCYDIRAQ